MLDLKDISEHCMYGKYEHVTKDKELDMPYPQNVGMFLVKRPHATFYTLDNINPEDPFPILEEVTMDKGDILLVTPAKTGTHWVNEIIHMLKNGNTEYVKEWKLSHTLEVTPYNKIIENSTPGTRVINTHLQLSCLPQNFRRSDTKVVMTMRNMKDTMVSYHHHMMLFRNGAVGDTKTEWGNSFKYLLYSQVQGQEILGKTVAYIIFYVKEPWSSHFDMYAEMWDKNRSDPNVLIVHYEELKLNTHNQIKRIAEHIGVVCSEDLVASIADAVDISKMKQGKYESELALRQFKGDSASMYRKGEIGDWKNWFTVAQNEEFHKVFDTWNKDRQIPFIYE